MVARRGSTRGRHKALLVEDSSRDVAQDAANADSHSPVAPATVTKTSVAANKRSTARAQAPTGGRKEATPRRKSTAGRNKKRKVGDENTTTKGAKPSTGATTKAQGKRTSSRDKFQEGEEEALGWILKISEVEY